MKFRNFQEILKFKSSKKKSKNELSFKAVSLSWLASPEAKNMKWNFELFNVLFSNVLKKNSSLAVASLKLLKENTDENCLQTFHIDLYTKIQMALSLDLVILLKMFTFF